MCGRGPPLAASAPGSSRVPSRTAHRDHDQWSDEVSVGPVPQAVMDNRAMLGTEKSVCGRSNILNIRSSTVTVLLSITACWTRSVSGAQTRYWIIQYLCAGGRSRPSQWAEERVDFARMRKRKRQCPQLTKATPISSVQTPVSMSSKSACAFKTAGAKSFSSFKTVECIKPTADFPPTRPETSSPIPVCCPAACSRRSESARPGKGQNGSHNSPNQ